jgi:predicted protein tyrosine phosphatase
LPEDPRVVIGDVGALHSMQNEVDVVVSLCRMGREDVRSDVEHHEIFLIDSDSAGDNPNLDFVVDDLVDLIRKWSDENKTVFVHCVRAENRTPLIAAAYAASKIGCSGRQALQRVIRLLPSARPSEAFENVLIRLYPGRK